MKNVLIKITAFFVFKFCFLVPKSKWRHKIRANWNAKLEKLNEIDFATVNGIKFNVNESEFWKRFNSREWEPETFNIYKKYLSPFKKVIDVGAWIGPTVLLAYSLNPKKILAIEADPANYQILKNNCYNNYLEDKVELMSTCIGAKNNEIVSFGYIDSTILDSSTKAVGGDGIKVITTSFLDILKNQNLDEVNFIKIDIEGGERFINEGLGYISKHKDIIILLSIHTPFWDDKKLVADILLAEICKFSVFTENDEELPLEKLAEMMLAESVMVEPLTHWKDKTGLFFSIILKT